MLRSFLFPVLISLVALVSHGAVPDISVHGQDRPLLSARFLTEVSFEPASRMFSVNGSFAEDESFSYLGTPGGLVRFPRFIEEGSQGTLFAFPGKSISNLYIHEGSLYVLKEGEASTGPGNDHTFLRSDDGARTFTPLDRQLESCINGICQFMSPTQASFRGRDILLAAGGNVLASEDGGANWKALIGFLEPAACYDPSFAWVDRRVIVGGECPLDMAYVRAGTLLPDRLEWDSNGQPSAVLTPDLENRNIQFIHSVPATSIVYAGIEGGILKSTDGGASFGFVLRYTQEDTKYPYVTHLLIPSRRPDFTLVSGFDKANIQPWLSVSPDHGRTWVDQSDLIRSADFESAVFLHEDAQGRVLIGLLSSTTLKVRIVELTFDTARRRAIRRSSSGGS